jgi:transcriptional regulator with XRE-family HTH domain
MVAMVVPAADRARSMLNGVARKIRLLRERHGMTQEDFAARCGISVSFASLLERGERTPSYETLVQVASALQIPLAELFREQTMELHDDPYYLRLIEFARRRRLSRAQVDRFLAVGEAMFVEAAQPTVSIAGSAVCTESGCGRRVLAKGLCASHYHRARRARE